MIGTREVGPGSSRAHAPKRGGIRIAFLVALSLTSAMVVAVVGPFGGTDASDRIAASVNVAPAVGAPAASRDVNEAIAALLPRVEAVPDDGRAWAQLGLAYLQKSRIDTDPSLYPEAETALQNALDNGGGYRATLGMGILAAARHDFESGLRWGTRASALNPDGADAWGVIGDSLLELGRYPEARVGFQTMVDLEPNVASLARVAYYRELTGDVPGAIGAMETALGYAGTPQDVAWVSHQIGELHFHAGSYGRARVAHERAVSALPGYLPSRAALAELEAADGHFARSAVLFREVIADKATPEYAGLLGDVLVRLDKPGAALAQYARGAELSDPALTGELNPDPGTALIYAGLGQTDKALSVARDVYAARPTIEAADALAWTLYETGEFEKAAEFSRESLRFGTQSAAFHFHAGMIQLKLGHEAAAQRHLETALEIHPNFSFVDAQTAKKELRKLAS